MISPDITVVIPVHNGADFVEQAIDSTLTQAGVTVQVVVVDDASTDGTPEILERYRDRIEALRLPKQASGIAATNEGLARATGEFVCVLHHDDLLLQGKLARHVELMRRHPGVGLSYSAQHYIDAAGRRLGTLRSPVAHGDYVIAGTVELRALAVQNYVNFCNAVVRRSAYEAVGFYPAQWQIVAEWAMWVRLARRYDVAYVDEPLVGYRLHSGQLTLKRDPQDYLDQLLVVHREVFDDLSIPPTLRERERLAMANVHLNLALVHWLRGERRPALRQAGGVVRRVRPWEWRDFIRSSAIVPRTMCRLRLGRAGNRQAVPAKKSEKSGSPGASVKEQVDDVSAVQFHGK
jgi:glycosyltransferase involved in cell wall biosynthesis